MPRGRSKLDGLRAMPTARVLTLRAEPSCTVSAVPVSPAIASGTVFRPMFTHRVHYGAPKPRGHRAFILAKQEWR
jgi:hypothetical protein